GPDTVRRRDHPDLWQALEHRGLLQDVQVLPEAGKETRSISYDALTAHTAIIFARYMMLALEQRRNMDERSLGELFYLTIDELEDLHYLDALASLLSLLMDCAKEAEILDEEQINQLLDLLVAKLPDLWGKCLKQCA
ncbi:hypothetical protein ACTNCI_12420, partial [Mitsuokella jalaludinii]